MSRIVKREIETELKLLLKEYPVVTVLGPRQAGKTTLAKTLKKYQYCNLENPEERHFALSDPKAFFKSLKTYVILDEIQRAPILLSYIQTIVDQNNINGQFILTGSRQLELTAAVSQSLAGRTGILHLLPLSIKETKLFGFQKTDFQDYAQKGFLPRIYRQNQRAFTAYSNYYRTYVERDIRQMIKLKQQNVFEKFIKLLAGRAGQPINYHSLSNDAGVDLKTIKRWLSLLSASFIIYKLPPYFENFGKRYIKSPKYYFVETGLLCYLLDIQEPHQLIRDPLAGQIFENLVVMECVKTQFNRGNNAVFYFLKDSNHNEVDLLFQVGRSLYAFEIKSTSTYQPFMLKNLKKIKNIHPQIKTAHIIYNGESRKLSHSNSLIYFKKISAFIQKQGKRGGSV